MDIIDKLLHNYENTRLMERLKARFLFFICVSLIVIIPGVIFYSVYLQINSPIYNYSVNMRILIPELISFIAVIISLLLLIRGRFLFSAHLIFFLVLAVIWTVMFQEQPDPLIRLDSIVLIIGLLSAAPIFTLEKKSFVMIYAFLNLCMMYIFMFYSRNTLNLPEAAFIDYLADNTVAFLFSAIVSYNLLSINNRALSEAERSNTALMRTNQELQSAMEELTASNEELEAQNEELIRTEEEKNVLIREVHHRVKNNMQIISSLLNMQADAVTEPSANQALKDAVGRIHSMASIHEKIYTAENFSRIDMALYVEQLSADLISIYSTVEKKVEINYHPDSVILTIDRAIPSGLIINEILTNSIKHGSREKEHCQIDMSIEDNAGWVTIMIKDHGPGMNPELFKSERKTSMGMQIIDALAKQIGAIVSLEVEKGTRFTIRFPKEG